MNDTPIDKKLKNGLKVQAKLISIAIIHSLIDANHKPIPNDRMKKLADVIYTSLYSLHHYKQSASAQEFFDFHANELDICDWEAELLQGVEG